MISPVKLWRNQKHISARIGQAGTIVTWTIIRVPPAGFSAQAPYPVCLVLLDSGQKITAQLVDWQPERLVPGAPVKCVVRRILEPTEDGIIPYGIKVQLVANA